jgi:SET domain-containing protein
MPERPFAIRKSPIHGMGLFAVRRIGKGEIIGHLEGEYTDEDGMHVLWLDAHTSFHVTNDLKYINHADEPNACYYDDLSVVALRDIEAGEEITHDYNADG